VEIICRKKLNECNRLIPKKCHAFDLYMIVIFMLITSIGSIVYHISLYKICSEICNLSIFFITYFIWSYLSNFYYNYHFLKLVVISIYLSISIIYVLYQIDFIIYGFNYISQFINISITYFTIQKIDNIENRIRRKDFKYLTIYFICSFIFFIIDVFKCSDLFMYVNLHILWHLFVSIGYYKWVKLLNDLYYVQCNNLLLLNCLNHFV